MTNPVGYFEIPVTDLDRAVAFYEAVLVITLERTLIDGHPMALFPYAPDQPGITGALAAGESYTPGRAGTRVYFRTPDIDAALARVRAAGGRVLYPRKAVPEVGFVAEFEDSEGNCVALHQPLQG